MEKITTEAWVLVSTNTPSRTALVKKEITLTDLSDTEVLAKPLYGCIEGNLIHALRLEPENIFRQRQENEIILGNAGVVQIEAVGQQVTTVQAGDICLYFCNGEPDEFGYPKKITAYDKPGSLGVFAKQIKLHEREVIKLPQASKLSLQQWAAFSLKYVTAWSNWKVAYNCWKVQMPEVPPEETYVFGWGGGVALGELALAKLSGCTCYLLTSKQERIDLLEHVGIAGVDRTKFAGSEAAFLEYVKMTTKGRGVSIFIDNIGQSVYKLTMKALGRQGVISTSGWKTGGLLPVSRANECQNRHIHVYTHYASYQEGIEAIAFAEAHNWAPPLSGYEYSWDELPQLLDDYASAKISSWFPIFHVNEIGE